MIVCLGKLMLRDAMNNKNFKIFGMVFIISILVLAVAAAGCTTQQTSTSTATPVPSPTTRTVTDMMGRTVVLPQNITKVITLGSVPVQNSFIEAMGKGSTLDNALPTSMATGRWKYQYIFAPQIANATLMEGSSGPNVETILQANPDVVFTMDKSTVTLLQNYSLPVVYLQWTNATDVKNLMTLIGQVFDDPARAANYTQYFDTKVGQVNATVSSVPAGQRPKVLYFSPTTMSVPQRICEWWISEAGGIPVSPTNRSTESYTFNIEQLLNWNPDIIITTTPAEVGLIYNDTRFADISAVKSKQVYTTPVGAHVWAHRTIETPLMVEWAASKFYPGKFTDAQVTGDTIIFYQQFFGTTITQDQAKEILSGMAGVKPSPTP